MIKKHIYQGLFFMMIFEVWACTSSQKNPDDTKRISANYIKYIQSQLAKQQKVSIIIYIPNEDITVITTPPITDKEQLLQLKQTLSHKIYSGTVEVLNGYFSNEKNFNIINRDQLSLILKEHALSQSGLLENNSRIKLGKFIGANYILAISHTTSMNQNSKFFQTNNKLIELSTGREITSDEANITIKVTDGTPETTYIFNNRPVQMLDGKMYAK